MIMADTNVLIDLREEDSAWFEWSAVAIARAKLARRVSISAIVAGELAVGGHSLDHVVDLVTQLGLSVLPLGAEGAVRAGQAHRAYRERGGSREKLLADFLIGGHAVAAGATLITRDARRYRTYFPDLPLITPETDNG
jgi:predicted nucleic acid-binding protein